MAAVLNRTTLQYLPSANTPDYPVLDWVIEPDLSAVAGVPHRYWKLTGDVVSEMSAGEKSAVDTALLVSARNAAAAALEQQEDVLRAFMLIVLDEFNRHSQKINGILNAVDAASNLATLKSAVALINDTPEYTEAQLKTAIKNRLGT